MTPRQGIPQLVASSIEEARDILARVQSRGIKARVEIDPSRAGESPAVEDLPDDSPSLWGRALSGKDPCPCGSKKRYKRCCRASGQWAQFAGTKLSEALSTLARPMLDEVDEDDLVGAKRAVDMAALAWNLALAPQSEADLRRRLIRELGSRREAEEFLDEVLLPLVARKKHLFPHDDRLVFQTQVALVDGILRLTAASLVERQE